MVEMDLYRALGGYDMSTVALVHHPRRSVVSMLVLVAMFYASITAPHRRRWHVRNQSWTATLFSRTARNFLLRHLLMTPPCMDALFPFNGYGLRRARWRTLNAYLVQETWC